MCFHCVPQRPPSCIIPAVLAYALCTRLQVKSSSAPSTPGARIMQAAASAGRGWENWMRAAWGRWYRTKDATQETWDTAKEQAYR